MLSNLRAARAIAQIRYGADRDPAIRTADRIPDWYTSSMDDQEPEDPVHESLWDRIAEYRKVSVTGIGTSPRPGNSAAGRA